MDLVRLRYFLEVAEAGSLSRASTRIGMAQPSLSRQIARLEEEMHVQLFYRNGRGVSLTEAGQKMRETSLAVFAMLEETRSSFIGQKAMPGGEVIWGTPPSIGATLAYPVARQFRETAPGAKLRIRECFSAILAEWIEQNMLDVAVLYDSARNKTLNATPLLMEDLYLVQSRLITDTADIGLEELAELPLVLTGVENGLRRVIDRAFTKAGIQPSVVMEVDSIPALRQLAGGGIGNTILPFGAIHREVHMERLTARRINHIDMRALLVTATPANRPVSASTKELIRIIQSAARDFVEKDVLRGIIGPKLQSML